MQLYQSANFALQGCRLFPNDLALLQVRLLQLLLMQLLLNRQLRNVILIAIDRQSGLTGAFLNHLPGLGNQQIIMLLGSKLVS
ncbi:hypothetical protein D3C81_1018750 [compost metagenome]